ncbi:MAG: hypothetical protein IJW38_04990 [Clostridia bacterium]|nr:hypothetical protein [Clostridia bacterium]
MLKYLGLLMLAAAGVLVSREYEKNQRKRLLELSEFIRFFEHIKSKISCFLSPKSDWLSDFSSPDAAIAEFLALAKRLPLSESFAAVRDKLSLGEEKTVIERLFSSLGKAYKDVEIELLDGVICELESERSRLLPECEKNIKTVKVLSAAISLGLIILLI